MKQLEELWAFTVTDRYGEYVLRRRANDSEPMISSESRDRLMENADEARSLADDLQMKLSVAHFVRQMDPEK